MCGFSCEGKRNNNSFCKRMTKGSYSQYTSFIGPAKSKKYTTHPWFLCNEIIFLIYMLRPMYVLTLKKKWKFNNQTVRVLLHLEGYRKANAKEVVCSNCPTWHLDFLKTRTPLLLQVRSQAKEIQGFCALDLCSEAHLFLFMTSETLSERAELALWEEENVLPTSVLQWLCVCGKTSFVTYFLWERNPICGEQWLWVPSVCFRAKKGFVGRCCLLPTSLLSKGSKHYILTCLQLGEGCWQSSSQISQPSLWLQTLWGQVPPAGKERWHGFLLICLVQSQPLSLLQYMFPPCLLFLLFLPCL